MSLKYQWMFLYNVSLICYLYTDECEALKEECCSLRSRIQAIEEELQRWVSHRHISFTYSTLFYFDIQSHSALLPAINPRWERIIMVGMALTMPATRQTVNIPQEHLRWMSTLTPPMTLVGFEPRTCWSHNLCSTAGPWLLPITLHLYTCGK